MLAPDAAAAVAAAAARGARRLHDARTHRRRYPRYSVYLLYSYKSTNTDAAAVFAAGSKRALFQGMYENKETGR